MTASLMCEKWPHRDKAALARCERMTLLQGMETKSLFRVVFALLVFALISAARAADPVQELAGFSVFPTVDVNQLAHSDAKTAHGAPMNNPRFASVQTVYVWPGTPQQHVAAMDRWNPM